MENNTQITVAQMELMEIIRLMSEFQNNRLPAGANLHVNLGDDYSTAWIFHCKDHTQGLEVKRIMGLGNAEKSTFNPDEPYHTLNGPLADGVYLHIECKGLPPMCRIETYEEEIPKTDIVTLAETVRVKRTRICCGESK